MVPKPAIGEQDYLLFGDATFKSIDTILEKSAVIGNVDILDAGSFITDSIKKIYDANIIKPYYRANTTGSFVVTLSYLNSRLTIKNDIQVAVSYMIISPLG